MRKVASNLPGSSQDYGRSVIIGYYDSSPCIRNREYLTWERVRFSRREDAVPGGLYDNDGSNMPKAGLAPCSLELLVPYSLGTLVLL